MTCSVCLLLSKKPSLSVDTTLGWWVKSSAWKQSVSPNMHTTEFDVRATAFVLTYSHGLPYGIRTHSKCRRRRRLWVYVQVITSDVFHVLMIL